MDEPSTRMRIVSAASDLFYRHGIAAVGMDTVRDEAQVSLRTLYKEFASKEDLVLAVLQLRHTQWEQAVEAQVRRVTDPTERLLAIFDYLSEWFGEPSFRGCGFINAFGERGPSNPEVAEAVQAHKRSFQDYVETLVADAGGTPLLAAQLALLAEGAQTTAAIAGTTSPAQVARQAAETLLAAAGLTRPVEQPG